MRAAHCTWCQWMRCQDVVFSVRKQVGSFEQRERKRVKAEQPEQQVLRGHGHVDEEVPILAVVQQRGLNLEEV
jgi:hypothetical protein